MPIEGSSPYVFYFVLLEGFSHLSLNSAVETLQNANLVAGEKVYDWKFVGLNRYPVLSSVGVAVDVDSDIKQVMGAKDIVIVSGDQCFDLHIDALKVWLARIARGDTRVTGLGTGAIIMARAGLPRASKVSLHPWYRAGFEELFPDLKLSSQTHISEGPFCSSSGGVSGIDLFLDFIEQQFGSKFADMVSESMCYTSIRHIQKSIDTATPNSLTVQHPVVSETIAVMEKNLENPIALTELASDAGISTRQLERLFTRYLGTSPKRHYLRLRLRAAYRLLVQSRLSIFEIALSTGFTSQSHFSKCFKAEYSVTPHKFRDSKS